MRFPFIALLLVACRALVAADFPDVAKPIESTGQVRMLVPGFVVEELPVKLSNQNNLRFAPDGSLTSLGYDGKIWRLRDTNGDGLEDTAEPLWDKPTLSVPLGMAWSTKGLYVSSKGKVSLLVDTNSDGIFDREDIVTSGWPPTDVGSGGVDATAVTLDSLGNIYFGLLVADYSNAYRLRKRKQLSADEISWLKKRGRWTENANEDEEFSLYDIDSRRGTIQKFDPTTKQLTTIATGIRVPVALAFNRAGDLFNTDQEGETWMPNGNPLDELNLILPGHNYGFPPRHPKWLPELLSDEPIATFGPQHQSSCGLVFNEPHSAFAPKSDGPPLPAAPAQALFGPAFWESDAFVAGESRGKIFRVRLTRTKSGYTATTQIIARLSMLTLDLAISPKGELYVCCHSGNPDWGTGPQGAGKIFRITYKNPAAPQPVAISPVSPTEVRVHFDKPLDPSIASQAHTNFAIEFGEYVSAGDRFEILKPPYAVVQQQDATPRGHLAVRGARLDERGRTLVLTTDPHPLPVHYALTLPSIKAQNASGPGETVDLEYDLKDIPWAPKARASSGSNSRAPQKPDGDWEHGRELFFGAQIQCAKCHRIRGEGALIGPDLSNLAFRDTDTVLRDIRDPGATIHPDYITYRITKKDGETLDGFIRSQAQDAISIFDATGRESVLARSDVQTIRPTELSLMPTGLLDALKETDVRDLLTFLMWAPPKNDQPGTPSERMTAGPQSRREIVLVASKQDHGPGQHDYPRWQTNWFEMLGPIAPEFKISAAWEWPSTNQFENAATIVFYDWTHDWSAVRLAQIDQYLKRGGGLVMIHSAIIADKDPEQLADRLGLSAQPGRTGYRHMPFTLQISKADGLPETLQMIDEPYWPLIGDPKNVTVLASAIVDGESRPLIWTKENEGRIFASVLGHYAWTFEQPAFRTLLIRGIAWTARAKLTNR